MRPEETWPLVWRFRPRDLLRRVSERLAQEGRWLVLLFAAWSAGILVYFGLNVELAWRTVAWLLASAPLTALGLWLLSRQLWWLALVLLACLLGFTAAKLRTDLVAAPRLSSPVAPVWVSGRITGLEPRYDGLRAVIQIEDFAAPYATPIPERVRINLGEATVALGERIRVRTWLAPPPGPAYPGAFDFQFRAYFQGWGGIGRALDPPERLAEPTGRFRAGISRWRRHIAARLDQQLSGDVAAIAKALLIGQRRQVAPETQAAIRDAGLAHLLAISGLHMTLVVGGVMVLARFGLALIPAIALRFETKRIAAILAFAMALLYLLLSGASLPTQRAALMVGLALLALGLGRRPLTLRNVTLVAFLLTLIRPELILSISFQLSFAAVTLLIVSFSALSKRQRPQRRPLSHRILAPFGGSALASGIATLATAPFVILHFQRLPLFGLLANVLAVPLTGLWIMPLGFLSIALMPLGWEGATLTAMGWGIEGLLAIARVIASLPQAVWAVPAFPKTSLCLAFAALIWLGVSSGLARLAALVPLVVMAVWLVLLSPRPLGFISDDGRQVAVREADGVMRSRFVRRDRFSQGRWVEALGLNPPYEAARCDASGCVWHLDRERKLTLSLSANAVMQDCTRAAIVLSPERLSYRLCRGGAWLWSGWDLVGAGPTMLVERRNGWIDLWTDRAWRGVRPWTPYLPSDR